MAHAHAHPHAHSHEEADPHAPIEEHSAYRDVWPDRRAKGSATICADIYQHWLEPDA